MRYRIAFYLPTILMNWLSLLLPFNKNSYKPSTEDQREMSQYMRNKIRITDYHTKRTLFGRK